MVHTRFFLLSLFAVAVLGVSAQPLQRVAPGEVGLDGSQLSYVDPLIEGAIKEGRIPGAVLAVVRHGKMAYLKAYGNRQVYPFQRPMTTNTVFDMASCSKCMSTAVCVMALIERGKLRPSDPVDRYIPGFQSWRDGKDSVTIRIVDLLTHTSGLPPYAPVQELKEKYGSPNPEKLMEYISTCKRDFRPETGFQYSCLNYITLQHVIENISHQSLRNFAAQNIFIPLRMDHTDYLPCKQDHKGKWVNTDLPRWIKNGEAEGITPIAPTEKQPDGSVLLGQVHDPLARVMNGGISGNAGVFTSADDVAVLCAALMNGGSWNGHRILHPLTVKMMTTVPKGFEAFGRTMGWDNSSPYSSPEGDLLSKDTYCHSGYTGTAIVIDPDNDLAIILLTNAVHPVDKTNVIRLRTMVANVVAGSIIGK
jgi:CubicO group peptidase (beta-lactamase class C family)